MMPVESIFGHQIKNSNIRGTATGLKTTHGDTIIAPPDREHEIIIIIINNNNNNNNSTNLFLIKNKKL